MGCFVKQLLVLKVALFCFYGGISCLWPFLPIHMKHLGLSVENIAFITSVASFIGLLGVPVAVAIAENMRRHKLVLVMCIVLTGISYSCLILVPPVIYEPAHVPKASFICDSSGGGVLAERCNEYCELDNGKRLSDLEFSKCRFLCKTPTDPMEPTPKALVRPQPPPPKVLTTAAQTITETEEPEEAPSTTEFDLGHVNISKREVDNSDFLDYDHNEYFNVSIEHNPYICFNGDKISACYIYNVSGEQENILVSTDFPKAILYENSCLYPMIRLVHDGHEYTDTQCRTEPNCEVQCDVTETSLDPILFSPRCQKVEGNIVYTFVLYLVLRSLAETFPVCCITLFEIIIFQLLREYKSDFAVHVTWQWFGFAVMPPVIGFLIQLLSADSHGLDFTVAFVVFDFFLLAAAISASMIPLHSNVRVRVMWQYVSKLLRNAEFTALFIVVFILGAQFGFLETFVYWYLDEKGASPWLLGVSVSIGLIPVMLFLPCWDTVVKICGPANLLIAALFAYSARYAGYSFAGSLLTMIPWQVLKVFTIGMLSSTVAAYADRLAAQVLIGTIMALVNILHHNAGRGMGVLLGGVLIDIIGIKLTFQVFAIFSGVAGLIYFSVYHFKLKDDRMPVVLTEVPGNGHWTPMETYSNGDIQAHKPMLQSADDF